SNGEVSVNAAEIVSKMPVEEQTHIVAKGKKGIVEAASQVRKTKSDAREAHAAGKTGQINKSLLPKDQDSSVIPNNTLHTSELVSILPDRNSEPTDSKIEHSIVIQDQVLNFVREALNYGATWIIAGKGNLPGILTDWSVLTLKADDDRIKKEPETEVKNLSDAYDNR